MTATFAPTSGRVSNHCSCERSAATGPNTAIAGARMPCAAAAWAIVASVATTTRCSGSVPRSMTAAGSLAIATAGDQLPGDRRQLAYPHVDDERARERR